MPMENTSGIGGSRTLELDLFKLGVVQTPPDPRTMRLSEGINFSSIQYPVEYDFDYSRLPFPNHVWGNGEYGDCVKAAQANSMVRLNRVESHQTLALRDVDVVEEYKNEQQREFGYHSDSPGDANDGGLVPLYNWRNWRNIGWEVKLPTWTQSRNFKIDAFGQLDQQNVSQLKAGIYLLHGIAVSIALPISAYYQLGSRTWTDTGGGTDAEPGSWGYHEVYCKKYSSGAIFCKTWGMEVAMTLSFVKRYLTDAWAFVDSFDPWRNYHYFNVEAMEQHLKDVGAMSV